jgi:hypothetical protein
MSERAKETLTAHRTAAGNWQYTITLKDTGTTTIGTFWFAWIPGEDFMPVTPLSHPAPAGWTDMVTNGGPTDGFAIQYVASSTSSYLQPGQSKLFHFLSSATSAEMFGKSKFYPTTLVTTSVVYHAGLFSDPGYQFHSSSNTVIPVAPAPGASMTELLGSNDHGIGDALGNTHGDLWGLMANGNPTLAHESHGLFGSLSATSALDSSMAALTGDHSGFGTHSGSHFS